MNNSKMNADSPEFIPNAERQRIVFEKLEELDIFHRHQLQEFLLRQTHEQQSLQRRLFLEHYDNLKDRPVAGLERMIMEFPRQLVLLQCYEEMEEMFESKVEAVRLMHENELKKQREEHRIECEQKAEERNREMQDLTRKHECQMQQLLVTHCQEFSRELQQVQRKQRRELELKHNVEERELKATQIGRTFKMNVSFEVQVRDMKARLEKALENMPPLQPVLLVDPRRYLRLRREAREQKRTLEKEQREAKQSADEANKKKNPPNDPSGAADANEAGDSGADQKSESAKEGTDGEGSKRQRAQTEREKKLEREMAHARQLEQEMADKRAREMARERLRLEREATHGSKDSLIGELQSPLDKQNATPQQLADGQGPAREFGLTPQRAALPQQQQHVVLEPKPQQSQQKQHDADPAEEVAAQPMRTQPFAHFNGPSTSTSIPFKPAQQQQQQPAQQAAQPAQPSQARSPYTLQPQAVVFQPQMTHVPHYHANQHGRNPYRFIGYSNAMPQANQYQHWDFYSRTNFKNLYSLPYQAEQSGHEGAAGAGDHTFGGHSPHNNNALAQWVATANGPQLIAAAQPAWMTRAASFRTPTLHFHQRQQPSWMMRAAPQHQNPMQQQQPSSNRGDVASGSSGGTPSNGASPSNMASLRGQSQLGYHHGHHQHQSPQVSNQGNYMRRPQPKRATTPQSASPRPFGRTDGDRMGCTTPSPQNYAERRKNVLINAAKAPLAVFANEPPKPQLDTVAVPAKQVRLESANQANLKNVRPRAANLDIKNKTGGATEKPIYWHNLELKKENATKLTKNGVDEKAAAIKRIETQRVDDEIKTGLPNAAATENLQLQSESAEMDNNNKVVLNDVSFDQLTASALPLDPTAVEGVSEMPLLD